MFISSIFCCETFATKYLKDKTVKFCVRIGRRVVAKYDADCSPMVQIMGMSMFAKKASVIYESDGKHYVTLLMEWNPDRDYFNLMDACKLVLIGQACICSKPTCLANSSNCKIVFDDISKTIASLDFKAENIGMNPVLEIMKQTQEIQIQFAPIVKQRRNYVFCCQRHLDATKPKILAQYVLGSQIVVTLDSDQLAFVPKAPHTHWAGVLQDSYSYIVAAANAFSATSRGKGSRSEACGSRPAACRNAFILYVEKHLFDRSAPLMNVIIDPCIFGCPCGLPASKICICGMVVYCDKICQMKYRTKHKVFCRVTKTLLSLYAH